MTDPTSEFDAEKRRRWYAAVLGAAGASTVVGMLCIRLMRLGDLKGSEEPVWEVALSLFCVWLFFFVLKYVAAYALWYRPYASRIRAIILSICATGAVYLCLFAGGILFTTLNGSNFDIAQTLRRLWEVHVFVYGLPYFSAALVGWFFARPPPDVRESF